MTNAIHQSRFRARAATAPHSLILAIVGFLTLVDLFATQALLPALARHYAVSAAAMGIAVNSTTMGMAVASLLVALNAHALGRRTTIGTSLAVLALPTFLLAFAPNLTTFAVLRICQGLLMATAFTLTIAYVSEQLGPHATANGLAAYVTGIVASNLIGRLVAASAADLFGLSASFLVFAALNLAGAALVARSFGEMQMAEGAARAMTTILGEVRRATLSPPLRAAFAIGFLILFAFIGTFTYINFVLVRPPVFLSQMSLGVIYLVFLPSIVTTPFAGRIVQRFGSGLTAFASFAVAIASLPLLLSGTLSLIIAGMALMAVGTFMAQAVATGFVAAAAPGDRAVASGLYLASYYLGGLAGAAVLGRLFDVFGWTACLLGIGAALVLAACLASQLRLAERPAGPGSDASRSR